MKHLKLLKFHFLFIALLSVSYNLNAQINKTADIVTSSYPFYATYEKSSDAINVYSTDLVIKLTYPCSQIQFHSSTNVGKGTINVLDDKKNNYNVRIKNEDIAKNISTEATTVTIKGGYTFGDLAISLNIAQTKFKISPHMIIANGSDNLSFNDVEILGGSKQLIIDFKSFLSTADITVESSNPKIFRVTDKVIAPANTLEKINEDKYSVAVNFYPEEITNYTGEIYIKEGGVVKHTISVSGNGIKRSQTLTWKDNSDQIYLGNSVDNPAKSDYASAVIKYRSSDSTIINIEGSKLVALAEGSADITAYTNESDLYKQAVSTPKKYTVTSKSIQTIIWSQNFSDLDTESPAITLNATVGDDVNRPITYTSDNEQVVIISGNTLTVVGEGETYIHATQAGNEQYAPQTISKYVKVYTVGECANYAIAESASHSKGGGGDGFNWNNPVNVTYKFNVPGEILSFKTTTNSASTGREIKVTDDLGNTYVNSSNFGDYNNIKIDHNARSLTFYVNSNFNKSLSNVYLTQATYIKSKNSTVEFSDIEAGSQTEQEFEVSYSNLSRDIELSFTNKDSKFTLDKSKIVTGCGNFGSVKIKITLPDAKVGSYKDTIILNSANLETKIPVNATVIKHYQEIKWDQNLSELALSQDSKITKLVATASSAMPVEFSSSNPDVAIVENGNLLKIIGAGTTTITAMQKGNDNFEPAKSLSQELTITKLDQIITWDQQFVNSLTIGDQITLEAASSSNLDVIFTSDNTEVAIVVDNMLNIVGAGSANIIASQAGNSNYNAAEIIIKSISVSKLDQSITWTQDLSSLKVGDNIKLTAAASSGLEITYTSSEPAVASVVNDILKIIAPGSVTITAVQVGDNNYNPASKEIQLSFGLQDQILTWFDELTNLVVDDIITLTASTSAGDLPIIFSSDNTDVAVISGNKLSIVGAGTANITASQVGNTEFNSVSLVKTINVKFIEQTIEWNDDLSTLDLLNNNTVDLTAVSTSGLPVEYISNNSKVATVENNKLTIVGAGDAIITAKQSGNNKYTSAEDIAKTIKISKLDQEIIWEQKIDTIYMGTEYVDLTAYATSGLFITYTLSNETVAQVDGNRLFIIKAGEVDIHATQKGNENYNPAKDVIKIVIVEKLDQKIIWEQDLALISILNDVKLTAEATSNLPVYYESSDENIAEIVDNYLCPLTAGDVTITAYQKGDEVYKAAKFVQMKVHITTDEVGTGIEFINDEFFFDPSNMKDPVIRVFDTMGHLVFFEDISDCTSFNLPSLTNGIYIITLNGAMYKIVR